MKRIKYLISIGSIGIFGLFLIFGSKLVLGSEKSVSKKQAFEKSKSIKLQRSPSERVVGEINLGYDIKENIFPLIEKFTDEEVRFYGEDGKIVSRQSLRLPPSDKSPWYAQPYAVSYLSKNGNFVGIYRVFEVGEKYQPLQTTFTVYNKNGEELWMTEEKLAGGDEGYSVYISDFDGSAVIHRPEYAGLVFYSPLGQKRIVALFGDAGWAVRCAAGAYSDCGKYFAVIITETGLRKGLEKPETAIWVVLFDRTGNEIFREPLDEKIPNRVAVSSGGDYILVSGHTVELKPSKVNWVSQSVFVLDKEGNQRKIENISFDDAVFSSDSKYAVMHYHGSVYLADMEKAKILWEKSIVPWSRRQKERVEEIASIDISSDEGLVLVQKARHDEEDWSLFVNPQVFLFNKKGEQIWQRKFEGRKCGFARIADDGEKLYMGLDGEIKVFNRVFK